MDRWRKIAHRLFSNCRQILSKNHFQLINVILILGGINCQDASKRWAAVMCHLSKVLATVHTIIVVMCFIENLQLKDYASAVYFLVIQILFASSLIREYLMRKNSTHLDEVKNFLNQEQIISHDNQHDSAMRRKLHRKIMITCLVLVANLTVCELSAPFLTLQENKFYRIPQLLLSLGPTWSTLIQWVYVMTIFPFWTSKAFGPTVLITAIMSSLETEYAIMVNGFESFVRSVRSGQDSIVPINAITGSISWNLLKEHLHFHVNQHLLLTENFAKIQQVIRYLYCVIHYSSMVLVAVAIYLVLLEDSLTGMLISAVAVVFFTLECFWWCSVAEYFPSINAALEEHIANLSLAIPYHRHQHSDCIQLRTTLMVFKMNVRNSAVFSCAEMFQLSRASYLQIVQKSYALFTFMLNVGLANPK